MWKHSHLIPSVLFILSFVVVASTITWDMAIPSHKRNFTGTLDIVGSGASNITFNVTAMNSSPWIQFSQNVGTTPAQLVVTIDASTFNSSSETIEVFVADLFQPTYINVAPVVYFTSIASVPDPIDIPYVVGLSRNQTFYIPLTNNDSNPVDYELPITGTFNAQIVIQYYLKDDFGGSATSGKLIGTLIPGETRKIEGVVTIPENLDLGESQIDTVVPVKFYPNANPTVTTTLVLKVYSDGFTIVPSFIVILFFFSAVL